MFTQIGSCRLSYGDCREVMRTMPDEYVHSIVTDPPYHLTQASRNGSPRQNDPATPFGRTKLGSAGFMSKTWDGGDIAHSVDLWQAALRVAKPGAHLLAFGGTRTFHRLTCAIEDAGWEIRDCIMWVYGSGFPKSLDVSKAIDKEAGAERELGPKRVSAWQGWGTALKPAWEPIIVARKPLAGTVAENVQQYGTGGINVDGCRVEMSRDDADFIKKTARPNSSGQLCVGAVMNRPSHPTAAVHDSGRFPANLIHDGSDEVLAGFPQTTSMDHRPRTGVQKRTDGYGMTVVNGAEVANNGFGDFGSAARFFYCAKASSEERGASNNHPTVKPLALMRYLVKLVTPKKGICLDPFMGSGTTLVAAMYERCRAIGIDLELQYHEIAMERIKKANFECARMLG